MVINCIRKRSSAKAVLVSKETFKEAYRLVKEHSAYNAKTYRHSPNDNLMVIMIPHDYAVAEVIHVPFGHYLVVNEDRSIGAYSKTGFKHMFAEYEPPEEVVAKKLAKIKEWAAIIQRATCCYGRVEGEGGICDCKFLPRDNPGKMVLGERNTVCCEATSIMRLVDSIMEGHDD